MTTINNQDLVLSLIRDSLINFKLIPGLNTLGLNADDYHVHLPDTIFKLMELQHHKQSDELFERIYMANAQKVRHISFSSSTEELDKLSKEIYQELVFVKEIYRKE